MAYKTLLVEERDGILSVTLNRPDVHNAFNDELIGEAIEIFSNLGSSLRAVVLGGSGANFCAGADLNWMARMVSYTRDENIRDSSKLAKMYAVINECPLPVVGRIQGAAIGWFGVVAPAGTMATSAVIVSRRSVVTVVFGMAPPRVCWQPGAHDIPNKHRSQEEPIRVAGVPCRS